MIKLKGVSKYYHSKGIVSTGMLRIDLEMSLGEFVVITGESGSGKSTLLNVISGLDSYEEGEMYVCGEETSAYTESDYENYRKKYISNIFQNFNLVNSYTVYQNVALAMQLTGGRAGKQQRAKINEVLKKVGLYRYRHAMASRLSGGQKQRVAIARALVRNTPVIVADEPTGNLDSKAAAAVLKLLKKIASDKLVIVVTHNYDQVEEYATRKITMSDGRIIEDRQIAPPPGGTDAVGSDYDGNLRRIRLLQKLRLGLRNTFNIVPKFLLLTFIFIFTTFAVSGFYATMRKNSYDSSLNGYNWYFQDTSDKRLVLKKEDLSAFTEEDYEAISQLPNADHIIREDLLLDRYVQCSCDSYYLYGMMQPASAVPSELAYGRHAGDETEMVISISSGYYLNDEETVQAMMEQDFYFYSNYDGSRITTKPVKVVGVAISEERNRWYVDFYVDSSVSAQVQSAVNYEFATVTTYVNGNELKGDPWNYQNKVMPAWWVPAGSVLAPEDWNYMFPENYDYEAVGKYVTVKVESMYYSDSRSFVVWDTYDKDDFVSKTRLDDYSWQNGVILINSDDYAAFFNKGNYQISLFVKDPKAAHETKETLEAMGYESLYLKDTLRNYDGAWTLIQNIYNVIWSAVLTVVLFFIDYSIIRLIMRSRNTYYSTIRMLGATRFDVRSLLFLDLFNVLNIAFAVSLGAIWSLWKGYISIESTFVTDILTYLSARDYLVIYAVLFVICFVISRKYAKQLFTDSALSTLRQEA
ncbi:MAG: ABC transporter ATP-binding protein/permease [Eubacteriaceae bacterium]|nr:ABC transporter ATP-binding protein/permease [Eubacteriaceae bacterium]